MKTPICTFDAKTGILCNMCENKLDSGQITRSDVEGSIILTKLALKNSEIDKMTLISSTEIDEEVILVFKSSDVRTIRSNMKLLELIRQSFKKNIWIVESDSNDRRFLENLFYPVRIDNINLIWLPDGHKLTRVVLDKKTNNIKEKTLEDIQKISLSIRKIELVIDTG
ncbi:MAG: transcription elongation factor NusA [Candidatus Nitrosocosmicus sp.]